MSEEDILFRVKLNELQPKLTQKITEDATKISDDDIKAYYDKNKKRFAQPERRDLRIVLTKNEAKANEAKAAIESGEDFKTVAKQYSIDEASKAQGGKLPAVAKGQQEKALDRPSSRPEGQARGPGEDPVRLVRLRGRQDHPGVAAVARARPRRRSRTCCARSASRRPSTTSSRTSARTTRDTSCADDYKVAECKNARRTRPTPARHPAARRARSRSSRPSPSSPRPRRPQPQQPALGGLSRRAAALVRLDEITRLLRRECPWDREQDERSIVPHTVEEAYELADAAQSGDDAKLLDELGDVLFQVVVPVAAARGARQGRAWRRWPTTAARS